MSRDGITSHIKGPYYLREHVGIYLTYLISLPAVWWLLVRHSPGPAACFEAALDCAGQALLHTGKVVGVNSQFWASCLIFPQLLQILYLLIHTGRTCPLPLLVSLPGLLVGTGAFLWTMRQPGKSAVGFFCFILLTVNLMGLLLRSKHSGFGSTRWKRLGRYEISVVYLQSSQIDEAREACLRKKQKTLTEPLTVTNPPEYSFSR
jgi:hypothetical protein